MILYESNEHCSKCANTGSQWRLNTSHYLHLALVRLLHSYPIMINEDYVNMTIHHHKTSSCTICTICTCLWNIPGIPIFGIDCPSTNTIDLRNLWCYVFCEGMQMTIVANHLDNAGFSAITKSSLLESMYVINQEKAPIQMGVTAAILSLSLYGTILQHICFLPEASFGLRVLSSPASVGLCVRVCVSITSLSAR